MILPSNPFTQKEVTWRRKLWAMSWLLPRSPVPSTTSVGALVPMLLLLGSVDAGLVFPFLRSLSRTMSWYVKLVRADPCTEPVPLSTSSATGSNIGILSGWYDASPISGWFVSAGDILEFDIVKVEFWERKLKTLVAGTRYQPWNTWMCKCWCLHRVNKANKTYA